ncbi:MAG TPA: M20/M25/M40 family metallo-hydrolase [Casimicrobiaceae bacterium]|nr:M20/M25/M40 family metallo-hydrolase [Casimicrobiaceae bacterium]
MEKRRFGVVAAFAFVVAITALLLYLWQSQLVAPAGAGRSAFSEEHAFATLAGLLKEQRPHTSGSPENAVVRDRILAELKSAGYSPEVQAAFQCDASPRFPGCAAVENIVAVHKGTGDGKAVLASAHYDSVPAGPGVSDDGAGVAVVLELARAYAARTTRNDVIFLLTDGEETGLRGARAFADHHPLMRRVGVVVNFDARGASGASMMFETGPGNARLMNLFARAVARPSASSVNYEVYKLLPNDTDFSVYRKLGLSGFNFGFINSAALYHSVRDNLQFIDRRSLQHTGEHAFEVTEALAETDLATLSTPSDASFFDVFGFVTVIWPAALNVPIALVALLGLIGLIVVHRDAFTSRATGWAVLALLAVPALLFAFGWLLSYPLGIWPGVHPLDHPQPWPGRIALATAGILVPLLVAAVAGPRVDARALLLVNGVVLALLAVGVALFIGGASYPFLWPVFGVAVAGWIETLLRKGPARSLRATALAGFFLAAFFLLAFLVGLELVLGFDLSQYKILVLMPFSLALVPLFAAGPGERSRTAWALSALCAVVVAGAAAVASQTPAYAPNHPRGLNVVYYDDLAAKPRWLVGFIGAPDERYLKAQGFPQRDEEYRQLGLLKAEGRFKDATGSHLPAPTFTVNEVATQGGVTIARGTLRSGRGGFQIGIGVAPNSGVRSIRVDNQQAVSVEQLKGKDPTFVRVWGIGMRDLPMEVSFDAASAPKLTLYERSPLPDSDEARALIAARPADAAPDYNGDTALVFTAVNLKP